MTHEIPLIEQQAKKIVMEIFQDSGMTKAEIARKMNKPENCVRRALDPNYRSKFTTLCDVAIAMGGRLTVVRVKNT